MEPRSTISPHATTGLTPLFALLACLGVCALIAVGFAIRTPAWQNPDEPAHYNYIAQVAANGCCPLLEQGDWNQDYQDRLVGARFPADLIDRLPTIQYEDHQPPLYYLIAAPVYRLTGGALLPLRLLSVVFGLATCLVAFRIARLLFPAGKQRAAWGVLLLVGLVPQAAAMSAAINNDALAGLIVALSLWLMVRYLRVGSTRAEWALGVLAGLAALTKVTILFIYVILPLAIIARAWLVARPGRPNLRALAAALVRFALPALALGGLWWVRNLATYGALDFLGLSTHDAVVIGQPLSADLIARLGVGGYLTTGLQTLFQSFWGQFGWMAYPMQPGVYTVLLIGLMAALTGLLLRRWLSRAPVSEDAAPLAGGAASRTEAAVAWPAPLYRAAWALMALTIGIVALQLVYYNLRFVQFQGRYLFPALIPLALALVLGLDTWVMLAVRAAQRRGLHDPRQLAWLAGVLRSLPLLALFALDAYVIVRVLPLMLP